MELKNIFRVSLVAAAVSLTTACGGDINITPTVNDNSTTTTDNSVGDNSPTYNGGSAPVEENPCASYDDVQGELVGNDCVYDTIFASKNVQINENVTFKALDEGGVHVFDGALQIGEDCNTTNGCSVPQNGPVMTVQAGATLAFNSGEAIIRIARGAKINAIGTFDKPITFTSAKAFDRFNSEGTLPKYADWGGIIINGNGVTDQCTDAERAAKTCNAESEGILSHFGGSNNADSSGTLRYAKIWYAGSGPRVGGEGDDLNSLTLNAVGSGSEFSYLHIHQGFDDGVEIFGGAADLYNIAVTDTQDDSFDFDAGWQGNAAFLFVMHGSVTLDDGTMVYMGNNGFETDGRKGETTAEAPETNPTISNVTVITTDEKSVRDEDPSQAFKFDDYINSTYLNVLMVKADTTNGTDCVEFKTDGEKQADQISFVGSTMACASEFKGDANFSADAAAALVGTAKTAWFDNSGANNRLGAASDVLAADGFATNTASTALATASTDDKAAANFVGAVSDQDTTTNWYKWVEMAVTAAKAD
jgi:hypothetical protein